MDDGEVQLEDELNSSEEKEFGDSSESESEEEEETAKAVVVHNKGKGSVSNFYRFGVLVSLCFIEFGVFNNLLFFQKHNDRAWQNLPFKPGSWPEQFLREQAAKQSDANSTPNTDVSAFIFLAFCSFPPMNRISRLHTLFQKLRFMQHLHHSPPRILATQTIGGLVS